MYQNQKSEKGQIHYYKTSKEELEALIAPLAKQYKSSCRAQTKIIAKMQIERLSDKLHFCARYGGRKQKRELRLLHPHLIWNRTLYLAFGLLIEAAESIRSRVYSLISRNIKCHTEF